MSTSQLPKNIRELLDERDTVQRRIDEIDAIVRDWHLGTVAELRGRGILVAGDPVARPSEDSQRRVAAPEVGLFGTSNPVTVVGVVRSASEPLGALDVVRTLAANGIQTSPNNVRSILSKAVKAGRLLRSAYGKYIGPDREPDGGGPRRTRPSRKTQQTDTPALAE